MYIGIMLINHVLKNQYMSKNHAYKNGNAHVFTLRVKVVVRTVTKCKLLNWSRLLVTCVLQLVIDLFQDFQDHYFLVGIWNKRTHTISYRITWK